MKKLLSLALCLALALTLAAPALAEDVLFWHTLEEMYREDLGRLVTAYEESSGDKVDVQYQGRVAEILKKVLAANITGGDELPCVFPVHTSEIKNLARDGVVEKVLATCG